MVDLPSQCWEGHTTLWEMLIQSAYFSIITTFIFFAWSISLWNQLSLKWRNLYRKVISRTCHVVLLYHTCNQFLDILFRIKIILIQEYTILFIITLRPVLGPPNIQINEYCKLFSGVKWNSPCNSSANIKHAQNCTSTVPFIFMAWCLIKYKKRYLKSGIISVG